MKYPRVLVVNGYPFGQGSATGLTMGSLFKGWPKEHLGCLYTESYMEPDCTFCEWCWHLSLRNKRSISCLLGEPPFKTVVRMQAHQRGNAARHKSWWDYVQVPFIRYLRSIKGRLPRQGIRDLDNYRIPKYVLKDITEFRPQVVYTMLASNPLLQLCLDLAEHFSIPVVPHFMDDWPTTLYRYSLFRFPLRRRMKRCLAAILERSPKRMTIGDAMAKEYASRYGGNFTPFMNSVESELLNRPVIAPRPRQKVRLLYVGGLHLNRWRSLRDIGMALKLLHEEGLEVEAYVYTTPRFAGEAKKLNIPPVMRAAGTLASSEVPNALRKADIVLHVESFDRHNRKYTRYSVSTKIPECMAAARPIFAYGPEELSSIRYVHESGSGLSVGHRSRFELVAALRKLVGSVELRESLGMQGHHVACSKHNAEMERERFRSVLEAVTTCDESTI